MIGHDITYWDNPILPGVACPDNTVQHPAVDQKWQMKMWPRASRPPDLKKRAKEKNLEETHKKKKGRGGQKEGPWKGPYNKIL